MFAVIIPAPASGADFKTRFGFKHDDLNLDLNLLI